MKVNSNTSNSAQPKKMSNDDIAAKIKAKFGEKAEIKKPKPKPVDKAEIKSKGVKNSDEEDFGDIKKNNPNSEVTQEKLRSLLKTGAFSFNDRERKALNEILN